MKEKMVNYMLPPAQAMFVESSPGRSNLGETAATFVYPNLIDNGNITIVLRDQYKFVRLFDISGHEILRRNITTASTKISLHLPYLNSGTYIPQLVGSKTVQQKIYITK